MTRQEYVRRVVKRLECPSSRKREIEKQLESHIEIGLDQGRTLEEILAEMGEPAELAQEFNDNFQDEEGKRTKKHRRILVVAVAAMVLAVAAGVLYWMIPKERDINASRYFEPDHVQSRTEEVILAFGEEDYETVDRYLSEEVREALRETSLETIRGYVCQDWGKFRSMGNLYMTEVRQRGRSYAIVEVNASFENVSVVFTLTFNEDMELYGFYVK